MKNKRLKGSAGAAFLIAAAASAVLLAGCGGKAAPRTESTAGTETAAAEQSAAGTEAAAESSPEAGGTGAGPASASEEASGGAGEETPAGTEAAQDGNAGGETVGGHGGAEAARPLGMEMGGWSAYHYDPDIRPGEYDEASYVSVAELFPAPETAERYPQLGKALDVMNAKNRSVYLPALSELAESCRGLDMPGTESYTILLRRADDEAVSFQVMESGYAGGVHGYELYGAKNLDPATGKEILLTDVIKDVEGLKEVLSDQLEEKYNGGPDGYSLLFDDYRTTIGQMEADSFIFTVEQDGVAFWFSPYDVGPYAAGRLDTKVRRADHPELFTGKYMKPSESYTQQFEWMYPFEFTRADGTPATVSVLVSSDEYGNYTELSVELNGTGRFSEEDYFYSVEPLFVHSAEKGDFLYIKTSSDNDYTFVKVFDLNGPAPVKKGELSGMSEGKRDAGGPEDDLGGASGTGTEDKGGVHDRIYDYGWRSILITDPDRFVLVKRIDDLSTYSGTQPFRIGEDGVPEALDGRYTSDGRFTLTALQDFSARESDPETFREGRQIKVPAGTRLTIRYSGCDEEPSRVWLEDEDGRLIVVTITTEDWEKKIDGIRIIDLFDGMMFAG